MRWQYGNALAMQWQCNGNMAIGGGRLEGELKAIFKIHPKSAPTPSGHLLPPNSRTSLASACPRASCSLPALSRLGRSSSEQNGECQSDGNQSRIKDGNRHIAISRYLEIWQSHCKAGKQRIGETLGENFNLKRVNSWGDRLWLCIQASQVGKQDFKDSGRS